MKYKIVFFSVLEKAEKNKVEKEMMNIKNLYLKKEANSHQLKLLIDYKREYSQKIYNKMISGVCVHQWGNYKNFVSTLENIIQDTTYSIKKNQKLIEESLEKWSKYKIKLKIWTCLRDIQKKQMFKIKKIQEEIFDNDCIQLKFLNKGN